MLSNARQRVIGLNPKEIKILLIGYSEFCSIDKNVFLSSETWAPILVGMKYFFVKLSFI